MKLFLLLILTVFTLAGTVQSQDFINMPMAKAEATLKKAYPSTNNQSNVYTRHDSILVRVNNQTQLIYVFDKQGLCVTETTNTRCDSCHDGYLKIVMDKKKYSWKKINENQYISRYEDGLMIELFPEGEIRSFSILRVEWTRELYDLLLKE